MRRLLIALVMVAAVIVSGSPGGAHARTARAGSAVAQVKFILHGLGIQPPGKSRHAARVHDPLYDRYAVNTQTNDKATIGFHDGTVVHLNQDTQAVITAHVTTVQHGEVAEYLAPGTNHQVQTDAAVASAIGTIYDVRLAAGKTVFVVLEGALQVRNAHGKVLVKTNHETTVLPNQSPTPPFPVDALAVFAWTDGLPSPDLGEDLALDANGGEIASFSSQRTDTGDEGAAIHINDGLLSQGWESATGQVTNQQVTVGFAGGNIYRVAAVIIDPAATYGEPASEDLKNFAIRVSSTGTKPDDFTTVFQGTCKQAATLQKFSFPVPVRAKYAQLVALSDYGSTDRVAVAEWEVVATESLFARPQFVAEDSHGFLYVTDSNSNRVDKLSPSGKLVAHWGSKGILPGQFQRPEGIAVGPNNTIYVVDSDNGRVQVFNTSGKLLRVWGQPGVLEGQLSFPVGIAVDLLGNSYITDETAAYTGGGYIFFGRVQKFSPDGKLLASWTHFAPFGDLNFPSGIAFEPNGDLVVADSSNNRLMRLTPAGVPLGTIGTQGANPGQFSHPGDVAVDSAGNIYASDTQNNRIERFDPSGAATVWGAFGSGPSQFFWPQGIHLDGHGHLFVVDSVNSRVKRLSVTTGKKQKVWGKYATVPTELGQPGGIAIDPHGNLWITDAVNDRLQERAPNGHVLEVLGYHGYVASEKGRTGLGQFYYPHGIAIDQQGEIYVADTFNFRVQELAPRGPIGAIGGPGAMAAPFKLIEGVAVDRQGNIYVADLADRIYKYSPQGKEIWSIGSQGLGPGQFELPEGLAVDPSGNVYVSDYIGGRIQKLSPDGKVLAVWGKQDLNGTGRFFGPQGLTTDAQGNVYVADSGHQAVDKLSPDGKLLDVYPLPGPNGSPNGVAVDAHGTVYATDNTNSRVIKFAPTGEVEAIWQ